MGILLFFYRKTSEACVRCIGEMRANCPGANLSRTYTQRGKRHLACFYALVSNLHRLT